MRKIFGAIFGSEKNTEKILAGIDKSFFTTEEKSDFFLKYLAATTPQNLARRFIAFAVVGLWSFLVLLAVIAWQWSKEYADYIFNVLHDVVGTPFSIIIGFYFLAHLTRQIPRK